MAATDARPVPQYGAAFRVYFALRYLDGRLDTGWINPSGFISKDNGAFANVTTNPVEIGGRGCGYCDLSSTEMTADGVVLILQDSKAIMGASPNSGIPLVLTFYPEQVGDYRIAVPSGAIAEAVWNEQMVGNIAAGTFGDALNQASGTILRQGATGAGLTAIPTVANVTTVANLTNFPSGAVADAVWNQQVARNVYTGTFGKALSDASGNTIAAVVGNSVWNETVAGNIIAGTFGDALNQASGTLLRIGATGAGLTAIPTIANVTTVANLTNLASGAIADSVWNQQVARNVYAGTFGKALSDASGNTIAAVIGNSVWTTPATRQLTATQTFNLTGNITGTITRVDHLTNFPSGAIADAIWDEAIAQHQVIGTTGYALNAASGNLIGSAGGATAADVWAYASRTLTSFPSGAFADAVWDEYLPAHLTSDSAGDWLYISATRNVDPWDEDLTTYGAGTAAYQIYQTITKTSGVVLDGIIDANILQVNGVPVDSSATIDANVVQVSGVNVTLSDFNTGGTGGDSAATIWAYANRTLTSFPSGAFAEAVWNEQVTGNVYAGTFGDALNQASGTVLRQGATGAGLTAIPTIANVTTVANLTNFPSGAVADAVWDEQINTHQVFGTAGRALMAASGDGKLAAGAITSSTFATNAIDANAFAQTAADEVWNTTSRTITGGTVANLTNFPSGAIADAVWDEIITTHNYNASAGHAMMIASGVLNNIIRADMVKFSGEWVAPTNAVPANITQVSGQLIHIADFNRPTTGSISSSTFASNAITSTVIAADAIGSSQLATTAVDEIVDQVWNEALSTHLTAGTTGDALNQASGTVLRQGPTGAGLSAIPTIAAVTTVTNLTNAPTAGDFTATMKTSIGTAVWTTPATRTITGGTVDNLTNLPSGAIADAVWDESIAQHQAVGTTGYALNAASGNLIGTPSSLTAADVWSYATRQLTSFPSGAFAEAVWNEQVTGNIYAGTFGDALNIASGIVLRQGATGAGLSAIPTIANVTTVANLTNFPSGAIADSVWDEAIAQHQVVGTTGYALNAASGNLIGAAGTAPTAADIWSYSSRTLTGIVNANMVQISGQWVSWDTGAIEANVVQVSGVPVTLANFGGASATAIRQEMDANSIQLISLSGLVSAVKIKTDYLPSVNPGSTGGLFRVGQNSPIAIIGTGDALAIISTGSNGNAIAAFGNGTGHGLYAWSNNGNGIYSYSNFDAGVKFASANGYGLHVTGGGLYDIFTISNAGSWNGNSTHTAADVWNEATRTLTSFPSGAIADAVWDEQKAGHNVAGTMGDALNQASGTVLRQGATGAGLTAIPTIANVTTVANLTNFPSGAIADAVWDEVLSQHQVIGTTGYALNTASGNLIGMVSAAPTAAAIADAVWDEDKLNHNIAGSMGDALNISSGVLLAIGRTGTGLTAIPTINTVTNLTNAPTNGDFTATMKTSIGTAVWTTPSTRTITGGTVDNLTNLASGAIADAVWDEVLSQHQALGTTGYALNTASGNLIGMVSAAPSAAVIADAVWDEVLSTHLIAGTAGDALNQASGTVLRQGPTGAGLSAIPTINTVTNLTNAPTNGDFTATMKTSIGTAVWTTPATRTITGGTIDNLTNLASGAIADAVWDEVLSQHQVLGTTGYALNTASGNLIGGTTLTAAQVWAYSPRTLTGIVDANIVQVSGQAAGAAGIIPANVIQVSGVYVTLADFGGDSAAEIWASPSRTLTSIPSGAIAEMVWNEQVTGNIYAGTFGDALNTASGILLRQGATGAGLTAIPTVANVTTVANLTNFPSGAVADAVWDEQINTHNVFGTAGRALTAASGNDFIGVHASPTNITAGTITTTTNLTNLPTMPTDWITAAGLSAGAVTEIQTGLATPTNITAGTITNLVNFPSGAIADLVWDEILSQHQVVGSTGYALNVASGNLIGMVSPAPTAAAIADAVWDEQMTGHNAAGSMGDALNIASGNFIGGAGTAPSADTVATAVWNKTVNGLTAAGSFGDALNQASGLLMNTTYGLSAIKTQVAAIEVDTQDLQTQIGIDGAGLTNIPTIANVTTVANLTNFPSGAVADAVWDEQINTHGVFGTAGRALTAASGNDFIGVHASPTNITTVGTTVNLTNLPTMPTDWITAAGLSAGAVTEIQTGLATPTNITAGTITNLVNFPSGAVADAVWDEVLSQHQTIGTAGYALNAASGNLIGIPTGLTAADVWTYATRQLTSFPSGAFAEMVWNEQVTGNIYAGTFGDALNIASGVLLRQGATGAGLTAIPTVANVTTVANLTNFPSGAIADAVWDEAISQHQNIGTTGYALNTASGNLIGGTTLTAAQVWTYADRQLTSFPSGAFADAVWDEVLGQHQVVGTTGYGLNVASGNLIGTPASLTAADVWTYSTRQLTSYPSGAFADAIWDEVLGGHQTIGTAGYALNVASGNLIGSTGGSLSGIISANVVSISGVPVNIDSSSVADSQELSTLGDLLLRRARIIRLIP